MVKSKKIFTSQSYCEEFLNVCPFYYAKKDELRNFLNDKGHNDLWDYPLDEIEHIVENQLDVVLVDTSYVSDNGEMVNEYRWFQIPESEVQTTLIASYLYEHNDGDQIWDDTTKFYKKGEIYEEVYTEGYNHKITVTEVTIEEIIEKIEGVKKSILAHGRRRGGYSIKKDLEIHELSILK